MKTCEICGSREPLDGWVTCGTCQLLRIECMKTEDKIRAELRKNNENLIGTTTPGMRFRGCSVNERRGRKLVRPVNREGFQERNESDELE